MVAFMMASLCACGGTGMLNEQSLTDLVPEEVIDSQEANHEESEDKTVDTDSGKVDTTADFDEPPIFSDVMGKTDRNGYDVATNQRRLLGKFDLSIPSYYSINVDTGDIVTFYLDQDEKVVLSLTDDDDFELPDGYDLEGFFKGMLDSITFFGSSCEFLKKGDLAIDGYECCSRIYTGDSKGTNFVLENDVIYDADKNGYLLATFCQYDQTEYNYFPDFHRVLYSILGDDVTIDEQPSGSEISENESKDSDATAETEEPVQDDTDVPEGVDPEFKEKMDKFEKFFDDYIEFMQNYTNSPDPVGMMKEYTQMNIEFAKNYKDFYAINLGLLSEPNQKYYQIVLNRISKKLEESGNSQ